MIPYTLRRSARAARLRITVGPHGVELVAPVQAREAEALAFLKQEQPWILGKLAALERRLSAHVGAERLVDGARVLLRGRLERLRVVPNAVRRRARARAMEAGLQVHVPVHADADAREAEVERALRVLFMREARRDADATVARFGPAHGLVPRAVRIKDHKRLWGSCTSKGEINLNWRLVMAPPPAFEYVVVHELCHLKERHHQASFWRLVERLLPDYAAQRAWLRDNGLLLTLRRPAFPFRADTPGLDLR